MQAGSFKSACLLTVLLEYNDNSVHAKEKGMWVGDTFLTVQLRQ